MNTYIYTLSDPRTGEVRYVGKTIDPTSRAKTHRRVGATRRGRWVQNLRTAGLAPVLDVVDEVPGEEWVFWEQHWIQVFKGWGFRLTNGDAGGLGSHRSTPELRDKIAATLRGRPNKALQRPVYAYGADGTLLAEYPSFKDAAIAVVGSHSNICRAIKRGSAAYGRFWLTEKRDSYIAPNYASGHYSPPAEVRRRIGEASSRIHKGRKFSPETIERMRVAALNRRRKKP